MLRNVFSRWIGSIAQWERGLLQRTGLGNVHKQHAERVSAQLPPATSPGVEKRRYTDLEARFRRELKERWAQVDTQNLRDLRQFEKWFKRKLQEYQAEAALLAKRARGDNTPLSDAELRFLHGRYSEQMRYFKRFIEDVKAGRGRMHYGHRLDLYAKDLWGLYQIVYWSGQVYTIGRRYLWVLSDAEHCEDCIKRASESRAKGGYTWEELMEIGLPGEGKTRCLNNCQCSIVEVAERRFRPQAFRSLPTRKRPRYAELSEVNLSDVA